jgi:hypothetical protein
VVHGIVEALASNNGHSVERRSEQLCTTGRQKQADGAPDLVSFNGFPQVIDELLGNLPHLPKQIDLTEVDMVRRHIFLKVRGYQRD